MSKYASALIQTKKYLKAKITVLQKHMFLLNFKQKMYLSIKYSYTQAESLAKFNKSSMFIYE